MWSFAYDSTKQLQTEDKGTCEQYYILEHAWLCATGFCCNPCGTFGSLQQHFTNQGYLVIPGHWPTRRCPLRSGSYKKKQPADCSAFGSSMMTSTKKSLFFLLLLFVLSPECVLNIVNAAFNFTLVIAFLCRKLWQQMQ